MTTLSEKRKQTNILNIQKEYPELSADEAYELYKQKRYHNPEKAEQRRLSAIKAGKASGSSPKAVRPFKDKAKAQEAQKRSVESRRAKNSQM